MKKVVVLIAFFVIVISSMFFLLDYRSDMAKDKCIKQYDSKFKSQSEEWKTGDKCKETICDELNLEYDGSGSWAKATIDCQTKSGGRITIKMPYHQYNEDDDCRNYFVARWEQAICLKKAGFIDDYT